MSVGAFNTKVFSLVNLTMKDHTIRPIQFHKHLIIGSIIFLSVEAHWIDCINVWFVQSRAKV